MEVDKGRGSREGGTTTRIKGRGRSQGWVEGGVKGEDEL
jgi:hypothetical protein